MKEYVKYEIFNGENYNLFKLLKVLFINLNLRFIFYLRLSQWVKRKRYRYLSFYLNRKLVTIYGCFIGSNVQIGMGVKFPHPSGIVIGESTKIGEKLYYISTGYFRRKKL